MVWHLAVLDISLDFALFFNEFSIWKQTEYFFGTFRNVRAQVVGTFYGKKTCLDADEYQQTNGW